MIHWHRIFVRVCMCAFGEYNVRELGCCCCSINTHVQLRNWESLRRCHFCSFAFRKLLTHFFHFAFFYFVIFLLSIFVCVCVSLFLFISFYHLVFSLPFASYHWRKWTQIFFNLFSYSIFCYNVYDNYMHDIINWARTHTCIHIYSRDFIQSLRDTLAIWYRVWS